MPPYKPRGYHKLAKLMSEDRSIAIFHRFDELNLLSLLDLQAEIFDLQSHFENQCKTDNESGDAVKSQFSEYFHTLRASKDSDQYRMLLEIREKIIDYNTLVIQTSQMASINKPTSSELSMFQEWLRDSKGGNCFQKGSEARLWSGSASEFISLRSIVGEQDMFTKWMIMVVVGALNRMLSKKISVGRIIDEESGLTSYDDSTIHFYSQILLTMVSSILPVVTIMVLYIIHNTYWRIAASIFFTALFSFCLAVFSSARRVEIFAATATFAAVEVVFVGSALQNGS